MHKLLESIGNLERKGQSGETTALFAQNYNQDDIAEFKKKISSFVGDSDRPKVDVNTLTGRETFVPGANYSRPTILSEDDGLKTV